MFAEILKVKSLTTFTVGWRLASSGTIISGVLSSGFLSVGFGSKSFGSGFLVSVTFFPRSTFLSWGFGSGSGSGFGSGFLRLGLLTGSVCLRSGFLSGSVLDGSGFVFVSTGFTGSLVGASLVSGFLVSSGFSSILFVGVCTYETLITTWLTQQRIEDCFTTFNYLPFQLSTPFS